MNNAKYKYKIYGRIRGRKKIKFFDNDHYKNFIINLKKDIKRKNKNILDIGSGNGENSIFLGKKTSKNLIIACDVFESGNVNLSNQLLKIGLSNVKIFPYNILNFFDDIKKYKYFNEIWILFPDPWPKNKHRKRRLINFEFIKMLHSYLKIRGKIFIATDSCIYLNSIMLSNITYTLS